MSVCRHCGANTVARGEPLAVCCSCANSPLCDRCGHPRGDHTQVFVRGVPAGCKRRIGDFQSLTRGRCDCESFQPIRGPLRDAGFAAAGDEPDPALPLLRLAR